MKTPAAPGVFRNVELTGCRRGGAPHVEQHRARRRARPEVERSVPEVVGRRRERRAELMTMPARAHLLHQEVLRRDRAVDGQRVAAAGLARDLRGLVDECRSRLSEPRSGDRRRRLRPEREVAVRRDAQGAVDVNVVGPAGG